MTSHQKVQGAAAFAEKLPKTAAALYMNETSDADLNAASKLLKSSIDAELYELKAGRHVPPDRVWSAWLYGDHLVPERREVLRQLANGSSPSTAPATDSRTGSPPSNATPTWPDLQGLPPRPASWSGEHNRSAFTQLRSHGRRVRHLDRDYLPLRT